MAEEKYPIGIQTFEKLIEGGFTYIDKTRFVTQLVRNDGYYFLSRPRRFGKSLLLSTLHAYFDGRRELFKGLYIDTADVDWTPVPVIHFDLNSEVFKDRDGLENLLNRLLSEYEETYDITEKDVTIAGRFSQLIRKVYSKTGQRVVILVDEYDKPLLEIEENRELFERNQALLKAFFGNLKSMDRYIKFAFLTGVARFNKVSIFSDLNNLYDISLNNKYADICGWTEREMTESFPEGILRLAEKRGYGYEETVEALRDYYDGYIFTEEGSRLYNPFSVLQALESGQIEPYWFEGGTPTFLAKRVKACGISLPNLNEQFCQRHDLMEVGFGTGSPIGLMFQTGYLTIDHYDEDLQMYKLRFPNHEVEIGFARQLMPLYIPDSNISSQPFSLMNFRVSLVKGDPEGFMKRLQTLCKEMPYESQNEDNYRSIVWLLCTLCGTDALAERHSYKGRSDLEVTTRDFIYVFEFKYGESVEAAMDQLHERDYAGHYALNSRQVYLVGANFSTLRDKGRGLTGWKIEKLNF